MFSFQNLEVFKKAFILNGKIYSFLKNNKELPTYIKNQWYRATLSIMINIDEGSGKPTLKDGRNYFAISRCSGFERAAVVAFLHAQKEIFDEQMREFTLGYEEISRMLCAMIKKPEI